MKTTTKTYQNEAAAEKAAAAKSKKTGIEYFAFEVDEKWVILTTEEFEALDAPKAEEVEDTAISAETLETWKEILEEEAAAEQTEQENSELLAEVFGLIESQGEVETSETHETIEQVETTETSETPEPVEAGQAETSEISEEEVEQEPVAKKEIEPFGLKPGYTKELTIPYFGVKGKYLKTSDPEGNRIGLASSRVHIVKIEGEMVTIKTTPTYALHRRFVA